MKISIITATYNSEKVLDTCLQSVINQDYQNIEYLIIDGKSTDNTIRIVKKYAKNHPFITLVSEPDKGIYDALNKGIQHATGDIIGFVHSDDMLARRDILTQIATTFKKSSTDGVYGDLLYIDKQDMDKVVRYWKSSPFKPQLLKRGWMPAHPTLYLKKTIYQKYGLFDLSYKIAADYDFILRVFKDPDITFQYLPRVITKMRVGGASNRSLKNIWQKSKEDFKAIKHNKTGNLATLISKNLSKINQFFKR